MIRISIVSFLALLFIITSGIFVVDQTQQAIVLQLGECQRAYTDPGLKFKIPFIQNVIFYDKRVLNLDIPPIQITTGDQKRLVVDTYTRYRINDLLKFFQTIKPSSEIGAKMRLEAIISSIVRNVLGKIPLRTMLSQERSAIMNKIEIEVKNMASPLGIEIIDVRIIRAELPVENQNAVFARMNAELDRFAKENRAKGEEIALGIKARAERERTKIISEAKKDGEITRGTGDAQAISILNAAYSKISRSIHSINGSMFIKNLYHPIHL